MNDTLCIIVIILLFVYICYNYNPITEGLSDVEKVLDGDIDSFIYTALSALKL